jgi:hypothetical protein
LLTQNLFLQVAVEEGVGDIELLGGPATGRSNGENHLDRRQLHDGSEGFVEVDAGALSESPNHPTSLVYLSRVPSGLSLCLNTHLPDTMLAPDGRLMRRHVRLRWSASNSAAMAARQFGSLRAARADEGIGEISAVDEARAYFGLGLWMPVRARVIM